MLSKTTSKLEISPIAKEELGKKPKKVITGFSEICPSTHQLCRAQAAATAQLYSKYSKIPEGVFSYGSCATEGYNLFQIICKNCGENMGKIYAKDNKLTDWRRLRYTSWHDDKYWHGLLGLNLENDIIRIECTCDPDNRKDLDSFLIEEIK